MPKEMLSFLQETFFAKCYGHWLVSAANMQFGIQMKMLRKIMRQDLSCKLDLNITAEIFFFVAICRYFPSFSFKAASFRSGRFSLGTGQPDPRLQWVAERRITYTLQPFPMLSDKAPV